MKRRLRIARTPAVKVITCAALVCGAVCSIWRWRRERRIRESLLQAGSIRSLESRWYQVAGIRMHARVSPDGFGADHPPVVLIHGWGVSSSYFIRAAERLACRFATLAPDLPGHGRSDSLSPVPGVEQLGEIALQWMTAAGLESASMVGHSMGCQVAIEMALRDPDRIDRLVLIAPTPDPHARSVAEQFRRLVIGGFYERLSLIIDLAKDYLRMGKRLVPEFFSMLRYPIETKLPHVKQPALLVRGENDPVVPQRWLEEAALLLGTDRLIAIPRWGHAVQYSAAPQLVRAIEPFLSADVFGVRERR